MSASLDINANNTIPVNSALKSELEKSADKINEERLDAIDPSSVKIPEGLDEAGKPYYENPEHGELEKQISDPNFDAYQHRVPEGADANKSIFKKLWGYIIDDDESVFKKETRSVIDFVVDKLPTYTAYLASATNLLGGVMEFFNLSDKNKKYIEDMCSWMIKFSFFPYGFSGIVNGIKKKNIYQAVAFLGEPFFALCGTLKDIYVLRGLPTGLDQIPVATEKITKKIFGTASFPTWMDGVKEVPKACWTLTKEIGSWIFDKLSSPLKATKALVNIAKDPKTFLKNYQANGHSALISSIGSMAAATGYMITGNESIFGPMRDFSGPFIDWEMLMGETLREKVAGVFFILESIFDFGARFVPKQLRLALNLISHACGRFALEQYKETYADDMRQEKVDRQKVKRLETMRKKIAHEEKKKLEALKMLNTIKSKAA